MDLGNYYTEEMRANDRLWEWVLEQSKWNHLLGKSLDEMLRDFYNPFSKYNDREEQEMAEYIEKYGLENSYYNDNFIDEDRYIEEEEEEDDLDYDENNEVSEDTDTDEDEYDYYDTY